jgi:SAM-dependent methyltransferase
MPHSWYYPMDPMLRLIARLEPTSVFDIGVGYGKWGFLAREMLDWNPGRLDRQDWQVRIDGVDVYPYDSPLLPWVYDSVRSADVVDIVDEISGYDLVIMSDVIEHIDKPIALDLVRRILASNRNMLISTPLDFFEQEIAGNEHEQHVSLWQLDDFEEFTFDAETAAGAALVVLLAGKGASLPTARDKRISKLALGLPLIGRRSSLARLTKQALGSPT